MQGRLRTMAIALMALCASGAAFAQDAPPPAEDGIGPWRFGMREADVRATSATAAWTIQHNAEGEATLSNGPRIVLGDSRLTSAFVLTDGALERIIFLGTSTVKCEDAVRTILADLEPDYGAFAGAPAPWELQELTGLARTEGGSEIRTHDAADGARLVASTRTAAGMFMQVQGEAAAGESSCHLSLTLAPRKILNRKESDAAMWARIDAVQTVLAPNWTQQADWNVYARTYPRHALRAGVSGQVALDCLIGADGALDCVVVAEQPGDEGFGAAAVETARAFHTLADATGASTIGKRYRFLMTFTTERTHRQLMSPLP